MHQSVRAACLWLPAAPGAQEHHVALDAHNFYVPPYVGPRGWLGVRIDRNLRWSRIVDLVREAYERVAPPALCAQIGKAPAIKAPKKLTNSDINPLQSPRGRRILEMMRGFCLALPETRETVHFGHNAWISLDVSRHGDPREIAGLIRQSYRHFALKRMLKALPPD